MNIFSNKKTIFRALLTTLFILFVFIIDPLGIRNSAEKHYEDHIIRMWAPFYSQKVNDDIVIILLDDNYLNKTKTYPVTYNNLSRLLKSISRFEPSAVFFDILQHHEHSPNLSRWLKRLDNQNYPVFMASDPEYDSISRLNDPSSLRNKISQVSNLAAVSWSGIGHHYPMSIPWNNTVMDTVALSMYKAWCSNNNQCPQNFNDFKNPMIVQWSNKFSQNQSHFFPINSECEIQNKSNFEQFINIIKISLTQGIRSEQSLEKNLREKCPPILTISAMKFIEQGAANSEILKKAIKNKSVLIGYHVSGSVDAIKSPVHGTLPGVFYHAMALDNLITLGNKYWHVPDEIGVFKLSIADIIEITIQVTALFLVIIYRYNHLENMHYQQKNNKQKIINGLIPFIIISMLIISSIIISQFILNVGAPNWYGLVLILFFDLPIFLYYLIEMIKIKTTEIYLYSLKRIKDLINTNYKGIINDKKINRFKFNDDN